MNFITRKIEKIKSKRSLHEYGWKVVKYNTQLFGEIEYAEWLHPYTSKIQITNEMLSFYRQYIKKGDLVIDIGAHTGDTTVPIALCAGKEGQVLALEPNPYVFKILEQNSKLNNGVTNIIPLNFAATDTDGNFTFNYSDASYCNGGFLSSLKNKHGHNHTLEVKGRNMEKYLKTDASIDMSKLALLKVDAEGYDKEIIRSLSGIIKEYKPFIICECYKYLTPEERFDLYNLLSDLNYKIKMVDDFKTTSQVLAKKEDMLLMPHFDFVAIPE